MTRIAILQNMISAALASDSDALAELGAEIRAYMLESDTLAELVDYTGASEAMLTSTLEALHDEQIAEYVGRTLGRLAGKAKAKGAEAKEAAGQRAADALGHTARLDVEGKAWTLDNGAFAAAVKASPAHGALAFVVDESSFVAVSGAALRKVLAEAKAQKWTVSITLQKGHTAYFTEERTTGWGRSRKTEIVEVPRVAPNWTLIVEYVRPSGSKGRLRFTDNASFLSKARSTVHVRRAANDRAA